MSNIQWTQELSVGVESIDADHKVLINMINRLDEALKSGEPGETVKSVLDGLIDYTSYHFNREEALMAACGYPDLDAHVRTHTMLRAQVTNIRERYARKPESIHEREVMSFLRNWLTAHILGRDKVYAPFMASRSEKVAEADRAFAEETPPGKAPATAAGDAA